jgi:hypothetical protein
VDVAVGVGVGVAVSVGVGVGVGDVKPWQPTVVVQPLATWVVPARMAPAVWHPAHVDGRGALAELPPG